MEPLYLPLLADYDVPGFLGTMQKNHRELCLTAALKNEHYVFWSVAILGDRTITEEFATLTVQMDGLQPLQEFLLQIRNAPSDSLAPTQAAAFAPWCAPDIYDALGLVLVAIRDNHERIQRADVLEDGSDLKEFMASFVWAVVRHYDSMSNLLAFLAVVHPSHLVSVTGSAMAALFRKVLNLPRSPPGGRPATGTFRRCRRTRCSSVPSSSIGWRVWDPNSAAAPPQRCRGCRHGVGQRNGSVRRGIEPTVYFRCQGAGDPGPGADSRSARGQCVPGGFPVGSDGACGIIRR